MARADDLKKLRIYYGSLRAQERILDEVAKVNHHLCTSSAFRPVAEEIWRLNQDFPDLLPPFQEDDYRDQHLPDRRDLAKLRGYVASALVRLEAELGTLEDTAPVTQKRDFSFISDAALRRVVERDYEEIQRAFIAQCLKSVIILSGGAIEAILLDLLQKNAAKALAAKSAPKQPDLSKWDLNDLIKVAVEWKLVTEGVEKLSHSVRGYRNLIHPGNEVRTGLVFAAEEARIAIEVLNMVHRELS